MSPSAALTVAARVRAWAIRLPDRVSPRTTLLGGLAASLMIGVAALFVGRLAPTHSAHLLVALQHTARHRRIGYSLVTLGLIGLTGAWMLLGAQSRRRPDGVRRIVTATTVWSIPVFVTPPLFSGDVWSYVANGMIVARRLSPYVATPSVLHGPILAAVSPRWRHTPAPYGPLPLLWGGGLSKLSSSPWFGLLGFRVLAALGLVVLGLALVHLARATGRDPAAVLWLAVASPITLGQGISSPHLDLLIAGITAAAVAIALTGRWLVAAVLVGLAAATKIPSVVVGVPVVLATVPAWAPSSASVVASWRPRIVRGVQVLAVSLGVVWVLGAVSGLGLGWLTGLSSPLSSKTTLSISTQIGYWLGRATHTPLIGVTHLIGTVLLVGAVLVVFFRTPTGAARPVVLAAIAVTGLSVVLSPIVHFWYYFWVLPFLAAGQLSHRWRRVATALTAMLGLLAPFDLSERLPHSVDILLLGMAAVLLALFDPRDLRPWLNSRRDASAPARLGGRSGSGPA